MDAMPTFAISSPHYGKKGRVQTLARAWMSGVRQMLRRLNDRDELDRLDDRMLADIGITRMRPYPATPFIF